MIPRCHPVIFQGIFAFFSMVLISWASAPLLASTFNASTAFVPSWILLILTFTANIFIKIPVFWILTWSPIKFCLVHAKTSVHISKPFQIPPAANQLKRLLKHMIRCSPTSDPTSPRLFFTVSQFSYYWGTVSDTHKWQEERFHLDHHFRRLRIWLPWCNIETHGGSKRKNKSTKIMLPKTLSWGKVPENKGQGTMDDTQEHTSLTLDTPRRVLD